MELFQLEAFLAVVREGSFSAAAKALFRTQPAISQTIKKLEDEIGRPLFDRSSRRGVLTDAGRVLADHAERHFKQEADWMNSTNFPAAGCHIDEHDAVMKSVREVQELVRGDNPRRFEIGRSLADELVRWFPGHADYLDSALSQWLSKKTHGGAPVVIRRNIAGSATTG